MTEWEDVIWDEMMMLNNVWRKFESLQCVCDLIHPFYSVKGRLLLTKIYTIQILNQVGQAEIDYFSVENVYIEEGNFLVLCHFGGFRFS